VFEDGFVPAQGYRVAYAVFGTLAVTSSAVSIAFRIVHARHVRAQLQKVISSGALGEDDVRGSLVPKLRWELAKVSRELRAKAVTLLGLALEDVPMVRARAAVRLRCPCRAKALAAGDAELLAGAEGGQHEHAGRLEHHARMMPRAAAWLLAGALFPHPRWLRLPSWPSHTCESL
jgi:hypothetical protein